jgi:hypothetical protein
LKNALFFLNSSAEVIQPLLYYISPVFPRLKRSPFTGLLLIVAAIGILNFQCSWTPEIKTVLYDSPVCVIALQTTHALKIAPTHPSSIPDSLFRKILGGITKSQEGGMLQQLLVTAPLTTPAFSPSQIDFLAPHLSKALSKATPDEIVHFRCPARDEGASLVQGNVAIFPPSNLLLTLEKNKRSSRTPSKIENSRNPQPTTSLIFFQEESFMSEKEIDIFMAIPPTFHGIVINYQNFISHHKNQENQFSPHGTPIIHDPKDGPPIRRESLNDQLRDLQRKVDQQAEEIRRLKQTAPP